jgi:ribose transport system ATP-binding protein
MNAEIVSVNSLTKRYGGVVALDGMGLSVARGTIHALVGENGAGKSTLMKILAGVVQPDGGTLSFDGQPVHFTSPNEARARGIGIVYQELSLFPERSVLANLFVNREPLTRFGLISRAAMHDQSRAILEQLGLDVDVDAPVGRLTIGERQLVELCRVLLEAPGLLILDEPNSALNERETQRLFGVLRGLRARGITMLYVSHRLEEVFSIADTVTVCRNGRDVFTEPTAALTIPQVIEGMIGGRQEALFPPRLPLRANAARRLDVRGLAAGDLHPISFSAAAGEIVGLAGLEGSGVATLLSTLFGMRKPSAGTAQFPDLGGIPAHPTAAAQRGVCFVPADRRRNGLMLDKNLIDNLAHVAVGALPNAPFWLRRETLTANAARQIGALRIKARSPYSLANQLSGGNQQKVVVGKWLEIAPNVVLLDDPTRGVDVGAKREIYGLIRELAADGRIVLFSSTELPELIGLCDRILVLYRGRLVGELAGDAINERDLLHLINTGEAVDTAFISNTREESS